MIQKKAKILILIIAVIISTLTILIVPFRKTTISDSKIVPYSVSIQQINLTANIGDIPLFIRYADQSNAELINFTCIFETRSAIISGPPSISVTFENNTLGNALILRVSLQYVTVPLSSILFAKTFLTINPNLVTNLTATTTIGNIEFNTEKFQQKTLRFLNLSSTSGTIDAFITNKCNVTGPLHLTTISGTNNLTLNGQSSIWNAIEMSSISGLCAISLKENTTITSNLNILTENGTIYMQTSNISLNNQNLTWQLTVYAGDIQANLTQWVDPIGNLTLIISNIYGVIDFGISLEANTISSEIETNTSLGGLITINTIHPGYVETGSGLDSTLPDRPSNFNANIGTVSGTVYVNATRS
ncbi:MAG: hypothetical protein ACTSQI_07525 [Candidatus Helarchaeota archaeon]